MLVFPELRQNRLIKAPERDQLTGFCQKINQEKSFIMLITKGSNDTQ